MRLLHLADLHFGKSLFEYSLIEDQAFWCASLLKHLSQYHYDAVVFAGDLFDRAVASAEAVELLDNLFSDLILTHRLPVLCIAGNHDSPERLRFGNRLYQSSGLYMAADPRAPIERVVLNDSYGPVNFYLIPFLSIADGKNLFPEAGIKNQADLYRALMAQHHDRINWNERNVVVAHGFFAALPKDGVPAWIESDSESMVGGCDLVDSSIFQPFDYGAFGHLHACQAAGAKHLRYAGSPLKYSVSEEKQKKCALAVTLGQKGELEVEEVSLPPLRQLRSVAGTLDQLLAPTCGDFASDDYVSITVYTDETLLGAAEKLRNVYPHFLNIRYLSTKQQTIMLGDHAKLTSMPLPEAFDAFYETVKGRPLNEEERRLVETAAQEETP